MYLPFLPMRPWASTRTSPFSICAGLRTATGAVTQQRRRPAVPSAPCQRTAQGDRRAVRAGTPCAQLPGRRRRRRRRHRCSSSAPRSLLLLRRRRRALIDRRGALHATTVSRDPTPLPAQIAASGQIVSVAGGSLKPAIATPDAICSDRRAASGPSPAA